MPALLALLRLHFTLGGSRVAESAPNTKSDALKRRSTRIVQAVPLTVTGVDALGRPFEERTSTSIISCHGCRYQSKHYVLKNMWVTLEVPHPEQGRPPRSTRARVMWIQRPRTVRELFQVGVELEVPGNLWGIAFGPPDWFPFPDAGSDISANALGASREDTLPETTDSWSDNPEDAPAEDNLRTMPFTPSTAGVEPLTLSRQMARLVNDAKLQLHAAIHDQAAEAVSTEARTILASLHDQLREAAERSVELAAAHASEQTIASAAEQAEARAEERLRELVDRYNDELARSLEQHYQKLIARSDEIEPQRRDAFEQQLQARVEQALVQLQAATRDSQATLERAREDLESIAPPSRGICIRNGSRRHRAAPSASRRCARPRLRTRKCPATVHRSDRARLGSGPSGLERSPGSGYHGRGQALERPAGGFARRRRSARRRTPSGDSANDGRAV